MNFLCHVDQGYGSAGMSRSTTLIAALPTLTHYLGRRKKRADDLCALVFRVV
jgi:hypothetical protein